MVASERLENAELRPPGKQLPVGVSVIAADVDPRPAHAGEAEILQLGDAHRQVFPGRGVVARPQQRVQLYARVAGTRSNKWPPLRPQPQQTFARGLRHQRAVRDLHLDVYSSLSVSRLDNVSRPARD